MKLKYFGTDGIRGVVGDFPINIEFSMKLGWAIGTVLGKLNGGKVLIGKDTRISGYMLESALQAGLSAAGMNIYLLGPMPTPGIAYLTQAFRAQAGIVISASHNPYDNNGLKVFSSDGFKLDTRIELLIEHKIDQQLITVKPDRLGKATRINDASGRYIEFCKSCIPHQSNLKGLKIVMDCANGATYHIAPHVFTELEATVIPIGIHPNGLNINVDCGSTHPERLRDCVLKENADLGMAFDGDGDRLIMVDNKGEIVDGDELLYIIATNRQKRKKLSGGVVGTIMSNLGLEQALQCLGVEFKRTPVGDHHILKALRENHWQLGGEQSGHIVCLDVTCAGDGIISALQVLQALQEENKSLHDYKKGMRKFPQVLFNVPYEGKVDFDNYQPFKLAVKAAETKLKAKGRVVVRVSGTEPVIRVMVEGKEKDMVENIGNQLVESVKEMLSNLNVKNVDK